MSLLGGDEDATGDDIADKELFVVFICFGIYTDIGHGSHVPDDRAETGVEAIGASCGDEEGDGVSVMAMRDLVMRAEAE